MHVKTISTNIDRRWHNGWVIGIEYQLFPHSLVGNVAGIDDQTSMIAKGDMCLSLTWSLSFIVYDNCSLFIKNMTKVSGLSPVVDPTL